MGTPVNPHWFNRVTWGSDALAQFAGTTASASLAEPATRSVVAMTTGPETIGVEGLFGGGFSSESGGNTGNQGGGFGGPFPDPLGGPTVPVGNQGGGFGPQPPAGWQNWPTNTGTSNDASAPDIRNIWLGLIGAGIILLGVWVFVKP